jgi:hypothetical protein
VHDPVADDDGRRTRDTELLQLEPAGRVRLDVDGIELDPP